VDALTFDITTSADVSVSVERALLPDQQSVPCELLANTNTYQCSFPRFPYGGDWYVKVVGDSMDVEVTGRHGAAQCGKRPRPNCAVLIEDLPEPGPLPKEPEDSPSSSKGVFDLPTVSGSSTATVSHKD